MTILLKRATEAASPEDGARVLVEHQLPRGVGKKAATEALRLRAWLPVLGPTEELRRWFSERPRQWPIFRRRYLEELCSGDAEESLIELHAIAASEPTVTLLSSAKDPEHSHAVILRDLLGGVKKPPSTSGPTRAASGGRIRARRPR